MINTLSLFSGLGAFERALENLGYEYNLVNYCEVDKIASKAYALEHCNGDESKNLWDVTKIDTLTCLDMPHINLLTYGFPCQDISISGLQKGLVDAETGEKTRSGLVWDAHRIIGDTMPDVAICENVKNLTSKKFEKEFKAILENLDSIGYNNYWAVLNAKDYGVPQNRARVFIVSIRKDIDTKEFDFPKPIPLEKRLKDVLDDEESIDKRFYLSKKGVEYVCHAKRGMATDINPNICQPLTAKGQQNWTGTFISPDIDHLEKSSVIGGKGEVKVVLKEDSPASIIVEGNYSPSGHEASRIDNPAGIAPTVKENHGTVTGLLIDIAPKRLGNVYSEKYDGCDFGGNVWDKEAISPALKTTAAASQQLRIAEKPYNRVRKMTPFEAFALMGFKKADAKMLMDNKISISQLYKLAGNSIVVDVLMAIFKKIYEVSDD